MSMNRPRAAAAVLAVLVLSALSGCGDESTGKTTTPATPGAAETTGDGDWLLRFTTAGGADGEKVGAVYVRYNPATGAAAVRKLPAVAAADASADEEVLLVSADHAWAIPDRGVPKSEASAGRLVLYSLSGDQTRTIDIRALTGRPDLRPTGWAFDPAAPEVLRIVDADRTVWKVDLAANTASQEGVLPKRDGWIFGNGFDKDTGEPYIESIDSDETEPAGNGDLDTGTVARQHGTLLRYDGEQLDGLPKPPCGFGGGFRVDDGPTWMFCADTPSISAYRIAKDGTSWERYGAPSADVAPGDAVDLSFALPPVH